MLNRVVGATVDLVEVRMSIGYSFHRKSPVHCNASVVKAYRINGRRVD
jgi:hypothetical protein